MKRFEFSLAKVLRLRERKEQAARRLLADVLSRLHLLENRQEVVRQAIAYAEQEAATLTHGAALAEAYRHNLEYQRKILELELRKTSAELARVREHWMQARSEKRSLERLRELRYEEYREDCLRAEQAELEEIASLRKAANARQGSLGVGA